MFLFRASKGMYLLTLNNKADYLWCALHMKYIWTGGDGKDLQKAYREVPAFYSSQKEAIQFAAERYKSIP